MNIIRIILLSLFLGITQIGFSQWIVYTPYNTKGIQGTMVSSGFTAADHKLWFGTDQGVTCYDPAFSFWTTYNTSNGLNTNFIYQLFEDKEGNIWAATNGGGISRYSNGSWTNFTTKDGLSYDIVRAISQSPDGTLWFGTYGHGICSYRAGTGFKKDTSDAIANRYVLSILALSDDQLLIGTLNEGLLILQNNIVHSLQNANELTGKRIFSIFKDHTDKIWLGTDQGAQQFNPSTLTVSACPDSLQGKTVYSICENQANELVFTSNNKICTVSNGTWSSFSPDNQPNSTSFYSAFYDEDGNGWFGSSNHGLYKRSGDSWYNYYNSTGLDVYTVLGMCEDKNQNMWFSSYQKIYRFDGQNWNNIIKNSGLENDYFTRILCDREGDVWFTGQKGLYKYDGNAYTLFSRETFFNSGYMQDLYLGPDGSIWVIASGDGVYRYDGSQWIHFTTVNGLASDNVQAVAFDRDGKVVTVSPYGGISHYDGKNWTVDNSAIGLNNYIQDLTIDLENNIWLATYNGIIRHKGSVNETFFTELYENNYFTFISTDKKGQIWAGRSGIGLVLYSGGDWSTFTTSDGLSSDYLQDIFFDSRGRTWILAYNGINMSASFTNIAEPETVSSEKIIGYPNPFSGSFDIQYSSNTAGRADIRILSPDGRILNHYNQQKVDIGTNKFHFEAGNNWPDGILFCIISMSGVSESIKLLKISTH